MIRPSRSILTVVFVLGAVALAAGTAYGAGFEVQEHGARGLANANAGKSAVAEDAVTVFENPAGMSRLKGFSAALGFSFILADADFDDDGSTNYTGVPGTATGGKGDGAESPFIPAGYFAYEFNEYFSMGLAVNAPFGLATDYDDDWKGRYFALESEMTTINVNPALSFKPTEFLSLGVGVSWQRIDARLSKAIDFGTAGAQTPLQLTPEMYDGEVEIEGDDANWGWNCGIMAEVDEKTRFGLSYRSHIHHDLEGDADFSVPQAAAGLTAGGRFTDSDVTARVTLPEQISLSAYHEITDCWAIVADVTWTRWSRFEELRIKFENPAEPDAVTKERWKDSFRYSLGAIYKLDECWTFRGGIAWDESPIKDEYRTARIPTNDRFWIALGAGYRFNEHFAVDLSYFHIFMSEGEVREGPAATGQSLRGDYKVTADCVSLQVTIDF